MGNGRARPLGQGWVFLFLFSGLHSHFVFNRSSAAASLQSFKQERVLKKRQLVRRPTFRILRALNKNHRLYRLPTVARGGSNSYPGRRRGPIGNRISERSTRIITRGAWHHGGRRPGKSPLILILIDHLQGPLEMIPGVPVAAGQCTRAGSADVRGAGGGRGAATCAADARPWQRRAQGALQLFLAST